jgi:hypothetical protein
LQTIQSIDDLSIPPVPVEAAANLRIRSQAVPELATTYSSHNHSRNRNSVSTIGLEDFQVDIRFPSPEPERPKQERRRSWFGKPKEEDAPTPIKRNSWRGSKRNSQDAAGITQQHAMAIINEWDLNAASLSSTPYDMIPSRRNSQHQRPNQRQQQSAQSPQTLRRPNKLQQRRTMDDKTAADYARRRSASIRERDAWNARKASLSRRSSTSPAPSRGPSLTLNMPPIPCEPLPPWEHRESPLEIPEPSNLPPSPPASQYMPAPDVPPPPPPHSPRPFDVEVEEQSMREYDEPAPPPPPHSPQPRSVERTGYFEEPEDWNEPPAPPPPSHSPRPLDITEDDPWASQAAAWRMRREHAALSHDDATPPAQAQEDLYPTIPLRREMYPQTAGPDLDGYHYPRQSRPQKRHTFDIYQPSHEVSPYQPEPHRGRSSFDQHQQPFYEHSRSRNHSQVSTPARSRNSSPRPPPHSKSNSRSHSPAASRGDSRQPSPAPAFGRFSGGLQYQYDFESNGLGGSAGTRENAVSSENARGDYKGVNLRSQYGVDLGDVPVSVLIAPRM